MPVSNLNLKSFIRDVPNFPKPGIVFKDITPLLGNKDALAYSLDTLAGAFKSKGVTAVAGAEARGFLLGPGLAERLGTGFIPIRKPGKLPHVKLSESYDLEYGSDTLEMHADALTSSSRVLLVDDLLATGGTMEACAKLVGRCGATLVGFAFIIELGFLKGRARLKGAEVASLIQYDSE
ncbi:MAG: adenine phosphoribosyltransferase [Planctomycetota bacterium]